MELNEWLGSTAREVTARTLKDKIEAVKAELDCEVSETLVGRQERGFGEWHSVTS
jgi:hypothetical protein